MKDEFDYDVVVVGGGPAGSITAYTIAKEGFHVAIFDKKKKELIGDKTCGDALDRASVILLKNQLGIEEPYGEEVSDPISKMSIAANDIDTKATLTAPGYVVDRLTYGQRLIRLCEEIGVEIFPNSPVRGILVEDNFVSGIKVYTNGELKSVRAKFTVDASGSFAAVRKHLPSHLRWNDAIQVDLDPDMVWPTYREIIELKENFTPHRWNNEIVLLYEKTIPIPGYFWIFSKGPNRLNVGLGWLKSENDMPSLKETYLNHMKRYYPEDAYDVIKSGGGQIPIRPPFDSLVFNGGALVGDAGCLVHPTTAEGHGPALESGLYCGQAISKALKEEKRDAESIWEYNVKIMHHLGEKHANALLIRQYLEKVGSDSLEFLIKRRFLTDEDLDQLVRGLAIELSMTEKFRRLFRAFPRWKPVFMLVNLLRKVEKVKFLYHNYPHSPDGLQLWREKRNRTTGWNF